MTEDEVSSLVDEIATCRRILVAAMGRLPSPRGKATTENLEAWKRAWAPIFSSWRSLKALSEAIDSILSVRANDRGELYEAIDWFGSMTTGEQRSPEYCAFSRYNEVGLRIFRSKPKYKKRRKAYDRARYEKTDRPEKVKAAVKERRKDPAYRAREAENARRRYAEKKRIKEALSQIDRDNPTPNQK